MIKKRQNIRKTIILTSFFIFPAVFFYMSPYLIIDATLKGIISGSFILFSLQFLSAVFLGRAFCGWVCPAGGAQETIISVNNRRVTKGNIIKWIIWVPWVTTILFIAVKNGGYSEFNPFYQTKFGLSIDNVYALITYLLVLLLIVTPSFIAGRRAFCHQICWMAPFLILGRKLRNIIKIPSLQLNSVPENCLHCHRCTSVCSMSLDVETMVANKQMENKECILCCECVDHCNNKAIKIEFAKLSQAKETC